MKKKNLNYMTKHHIVPRSRGGMSNLENIAYIPNKPHQDYHNLFSNKRPEEIVEYLVNDFWNSQWEYVERAYENREKTNRYIN